MISEESLKTKPAAPSAGGPIGPPELRSNRLMPRPPVIAVMGHVDHGKTLLLDAIRKTHVAEGEAGGITQHIGAYRVELKTGSAVFLDTPGHEAFTALRARGAQVTDVVVLVVAADEGVQPQTREAIDHARAAGVPVVVALNKMDKAARNPERVRRELAEAGLLPEEWGGDTLVSEISARQKTGIDDLLEKIMLQAELLELKADPEKPARGTIIESRLDKGRGPVATVLVKEGTLRRGDFFVAGSSHGRIRSMMDDRGQRVDSAGPSSPVEVSGFAEPPVPGESLLVVPEGKEAREARVKLRTGLNRQAEGPGPVSLDQLLAKMKEGEKEFRIILKGDAQGSIEALDQALRKISGNPVRVKVIYSGLGPVTENDINLASVSKSLIAAFGVGAGPEAKQLAAREGVEIRSYSVIYDLVSDVEKWMEGLREHPVEERLLGKAEVIAVFDIRGVGKIAGSRVSEGKAVRGSQARVLRNGGVIHSGKIVSLRHLKEDRRECTRGLECGFLIENFKDARTGDIIESVDRGTNPPAGVQP